MSYRKTKSAVFLLISLFASFHVIYGIISFTELFWHESHETVGEHGMTMAGMAVNLTVILYRDQCFQVPPAVVLLQNFALFFLFY